MLQVLVEDCVLRPVGCCDHQVTVFADKYVFYRFWFDDEGKECFPATQVRPTTIDNNKTIRSPRCPCRCPTAGRATHRANGAASKFDHPGEHGARRRLPPGAAQGATRTAAMPIMMSDV